MPNRRMFSTRIGNSARFLQMPVETQLLYFHLVLRADDDGVVEAYPIMRLLGLPPDNFKVLLAKGFIRELNEDQVVVVVDWLEHNTIRADRKVDSIYKNLLHSKYPDIPLLEAKPRTDVVDNSRRLAVDSPRTAEVKLGEVKLSQVKLNKEREREEKKPNTLPTKILEDKDIEEIANELSVSVKSVKWTYEKIKDYEAEKGKKYRDYKATLRNWIRRDIDEGKIRVTNGDKKVVDATLLRILKERGGGNGG